MASLTTDISNDKTSKTSKIAMVILLVLGVAIANIPGLTVTHMFLFYCTFRATTMLPTMLTLMNIKLKASGVVSGIISALVVGLPIFAYGNIYGIATYKTVGSLITLLSAGIVALIVSKLSKKEARQ